MTILVVGYHFMRTQSAGGHRLHAIVKYLSRLGWKATVLTVRGDAAKSGEANEDTVFSFIPPGVRVVRTRSFEPTWMWTGLRRTESAESLNIADTNRGVRRRDHEQAMKLVNAWKVPARWLRAMLSFPDRRIGWFLPLMVASWRILRREKFDVVFTSGPPHSSILPFLLLKRCFHFVWVCDFRDPWTDPPWYGIDSVSFTKRRVLFPLNQLLERWVLQSCDRILANTQGNSEALQRSFAPIVNDKLMVLTNGFDDEMSVKFLGSETSVLSCDFVFTGSMYRWMLDLYLEALELMRIGGQRLPVLYIFGDVDNELRTKVREAGFEQHVIFKGSVSYGDSLAVLGRAKALLLLFIGHQEVFRCSVPSKLYAYLFSGRPYLALAPEGDAARICEDVGGGVVVKSSDPRDVARGITYFLHMLDSGQIAQVRNEVPLRSYAWSSLAKRLDDALRVDIARTGW